MRKKYTYENAIIQITIPDNCYKNIRKATEQFLHKVVKERESKWQQ